jgi:UDP-N-acetylmuramoyl-L-alanyl-D-glutamate--2,6-diaminopimelate ligase
VEDGVSLRLDALVAGLAARIAGDGSVDIHELAYDSRAVAPGSLFVALRGERTDGHRYCDSALRAGAAALLVEELPSDVSPQVPVALVPDTRAALADVAARLYGSPALGMTLVAVTGTNGKSSTVRLIESILAAAGRRVGSSSTIATRFAGREEPARMTTPESADLQRTLARMRAAGVDTAVLEVSSHALEQDRVRPLRFDVAVFTHLSQDHLDFHGDMESYARAKARLFSSEYLAGSAVLNARDPRSAAYAALAREAGRPVVTFGRGASSGADVRTIAEEVGLGGSRLVVAAGAERTAIALPLPGDFQVENALAAAAAAHALGVPWPAIARGIEACPAVPGRLERVPDEDVVVLVDYAHTPDALDRVLGRVRPLVRGRLITVFGCGGDRDPSKRAPMARAACRHSDYVVATSDNPRSEDPDAILRQVARGLEGTYAVIADRRAAIEHAIAAALPGDAVVIAGKGHETYQLVGERRLAFDDREEARTALARRRARA